MPFFDRPVPGPGHLARGMPMGPMGGVRPPGPMMPQMPRIPVGESEPNSLRIHQSISSWCSG